MSNDVINVKFPNIDSDSDDVFNWEVTIDEKRVYINMNKIVTEVFESMNLDYNSNNNNNNKSNSSNDKSNSSNDKSNSSNDNSNNNKSKQQHQQVNNISSDNNSSDNNQQDGQNQKVDDESYSSSNQHGPVSEYLNEDNTEINDKIVVEHNKLVKELIGDGKKIIESIEDINKIKKGFTFKEKNGGGGDSEDDGSDSEDDGSDSENDSISSELNNGNNSSNKKFKSIASLPVTYNSPVTYNLNSPFSNTRRPVSNTPRPGSNTSDFESNSSRPPSSMSEDGFNMSRPQYNTSVTDNVYFIKEIDLQDIHPFKEIIINEQETQKGIISDYDIDFMLLYKFFKNLDKLGQDKIKEKEGHENDYQETLQYFKDHLLTPENELKELIKKFLNKLKTKVLFRLLNKYFENLTNNTDNDKIIPNKIKIQKLLEKVNENNEFSDLSQKNTLSTIPEQEDKDITFFVEKLNNLFVTETKESKSETPEQNIIKNIFEKKGIKEDGNCLFNTLREALTKKSDDQKSKFTIILENMIIDKYKNFNSKDTNAQVKKFILFYTHFMKPIKKEVDDNKYTQKFINEDIEQIQKDLDGYPESINVHINFAKHKAISEGEIINNIIKKEELKYVKDVIQIFYELGSDDDIDNIMYFFVEQIVNGIISEKMELRNGDSSNKNDTKLNGFLINELHEYAINGGDAVYGNGKHITFYTNVFNIVAFNVTTSDSVTTIQLNPTMFANDDDDGDRSLATLSLIQSILLRSQERERRQDIADRKFTEIMNFKDILVEFDDILDDNLREGTYIDSIKSGRLAHSIDSTILTNIENSKDVAEQKTILEEEKKKLENKKKILEGELYEIDKIEEKEFLKEEFRQNNKEYFLFTTEGINSNANHYDYLEKKEYFEDYEISIFYEPEKIIMIS